MIVSKNFNHSIDVKFACIEFNYDTCLAVARFHSPVNFYFPSLFWEANEFNEITLIFKMTGDTISFL